MKQTTASLFKPRLWLELIDFIRQQLGAENKIITVLAEKGQGKTSFCQLLSLELGKNTPHHQRDAQDYPLSQLIEEIKALALPQASAPLSLIEKSKTPLIIIDNAQNIEGSMLKDLWTWLKEEKRSLHLCLVANSFVKPALQEIYTFNMGGLTETETRTYLLTKLNKIAHITETELKTFYQLTGGYIDRINEAYASFFKEKMNLKRKVNPIFSIGTLVLLLSGFCYFFYFGPQRPMVSYPKWAKLSKPEKKEPLLVSVIPFYRDHAQRHIGQPSPFLYVIQIEEDEEEVLEKLAVVDRLVLMPKIFSAKEAPPTKPVEEEPLPTSSIPNFRLYAASAPAFTIQILASLEADDLSFLLSKYQQAYDLKKRISQRYGKEWHVLTAGQFLNKKDAEIALNQLPAELVKSGAWVRTL